MWNTYLGKCEETSRTVLHHVSSDFVHQPYHLGPFGRSVDCKREIIIMYVLTKNKLWAWQGYVRPFNARCRFRGCKSHVCPLCAMLNTWCKYALHMRGWLKNKRQSLNLFISRELVDKNGTERNLKLNGKYIESKEADG